MTESLRRVAVVGGSRIPFCRSNTLYAENSNMDMLTAAINGVADRFNLKNEQLDEVMAGAVINHTRDFNLAREAVLSSVLSPLTPAVTLQQACGTSLQAALNLADKNRKVGKLKVRSQPAQIQRRMHRLYLVTNSPGD